MDIDEQRSALDCLWYELWMLKETSDKLRLLQKEQYKDVILENVYLESFLVHARNLIYFLDNGTRDGDIKCSDFNVKKLTISLPQGNSLNEINKFLSHLTWDRVKKEKPGWDFYTIAEELKNKVYIFIGKLPDNLFPTHRHKKKRIDFLEI